MANIWEKAISILAGNLNLGLSYLITAVCALGKCYKKGLQSCTKRVNRNSRAGNNYAITALLAETQTLDVST